MNELKSPLSQVTSLLTTLIIGIAAFFRKNTAKVMLLLIAFLLLVFLLMMYFKKRKQHVKSKPVTPVSVEHSLSGTQESASELPITYRPVPSIEDAPLKASDEKIMMRHISNRISEKLKSAYPDATWQYTPEPALGYILNGGTVRIETENTGTYTHADIRFDKYAKIQITMLIIGEFASQDTKSTEPEEPAPAIVDVSAWYNLIGQKILDNAITDANAKGHKKLYIKENGDIVTGTGNKKKLIDTLSHFPSKNYWKELQDLLTADDLTGSIDKEQFIISWN